MRPPVDEDQASLSATIFVAHQQLNEASAFALYVITGLKT
jgi:hypothetical protein